MEIYDNRNTEKYKEFEKLLNNQSSKLKIEEGKIIDGKISKITEKYIFLFTVSKTGSFCSLFYYKYFIRHYEHANFAIYFCHHYRHLTWNNYLCMGRNSIWKIVFIIGNTKSQQYPKPIFSTSNTFSNS